MGASMEAGVSAGMGTGLVVLLGRWLLLLHLLLRLLRRRLLACP